MADFAVQQLVYNETTTALTGQATVYDSAAPDDAAYPFATIGDDFVDVAGSKTEDGWAFSAEIQIWSDKPSFKEVKTLAALVRDRLHKGSFAGIDGFRFWMIRETTRRYFEEEDGHGRRCVMEFDIRVQPEF